MGYYIFLTLRRQGGRSLLASGGFLLAACALILLSSTTQTTVLQAKQIINHNWRSTYDLVVLPPNIALPADKVIPPDLFSSYDGGISIQQYHQIQQLPGVAVAAPIAFLSDVQYPATFARLGPSSLPQGFYRLKWTLTAFNGLQQVEGYENAINIYIDAAPCNFTHSLDDKVTQAITKLQLLSIGCSTDGQYFANLTNPATFMLAAIDPVAEDQLVQLDQHLVSGRMLRANETISPDKDLPTLPQGNNTSAPNYDVPLLFNTQLPGDIRMHVSLLRLDAGTRNPLQLVARKTHNDLTNTPQQQLFAGEVPIAQNDQRLFSTGMLVIQHGSSWQFFRAPYHDTLSPIAFTSSPSGLSYQPMHPPSGQSTPAYTLVPAHTQGLVGTQGNEVAFRDLPALPDNSLYIDGTETLYRGAYYNYAPIGQFDGTALNHEFANALNWLPEATYASAPEVLRDDAQGHPIQPTTLLPTTNPAGFTLQPPLALTTLKAAQQIKGNNCISVIRVRIAGNVSPDEAGWQRVTQVAQLIERRTGLRALVTLGSSPQPTLVYIPGLSKSQAPVTQDIAPIGWAEERWISIGVALLYIQQLGQTQTLLLGAVLLVCLGYLLVTLSSLAAAQQRELALLSALGWRPWHPVGTFLMQIIVLALGGGIVGMVLALLIVALIGASPPWEIVAWTLPSVLGLALLSVLMPLWRLWRIAPAEALRTGTAVSSENTSRLGRWQTALGTCLPAVGGMALRNLARSRWRAVIAIGSLFLSAILLTVMVEGLLDFRQTLQGTLLGNYVLLQTAVPQLAGAVFALVLTFLSVSDLLLLQVRERRKEIGLLQAIGWRSSVVQGLFVQEGLTLAVLGTVPGVLVALALLTTQHTPTGGIAPPLVALGAVVVLLLVTALATVPAIRAVGRLPMSEVLRAE